MEAAEQKIVVDADDQAVELAKKLNEARSNAKKWGELADYFRDTLIEHVEELEEQQGKPDEARVVVASGATTVATITESVRKIFDKEAFKAAHPEIDLDDYQKVSSSKAVRVGNI